MTNNNLLKHVLDWEISEEESLADHNYIKFKLITKKGYNNINADKFNNTKFYIREDKLHLFDNKLVQEMQKFDTGTRNIAGAEALDVCMYVCMYVCVCVYLCTCVYVCMYVCLQALATSNCIRRCSQYPPVRPVYVRPNTISCVD
jgi:hypothetical protein